MVRLKDGFLRRKAGEGQAGAAQHPEMLGWVGGGGGGSHAHLSMSRGRRCQLLLPSHCRSMAGCQKRKRGALQAEQRGRRPRCWRLHCRPTDTPPTPLLLTCIPFFDFLFACRLAEGCRRDLTAKQDGRSAQQRR
jgi:hypothetical protein